MPQALEKGSNIPPALAAPLRSKMGRGLLRAKLGKRFVPTLCGIAVILVLAAAGPYFFARAMSYESLPAHSGQAAQSQAYSVLSQTLQQQASLFGLCGPVPLIDTDLLRPGSPYLSFQESQGRCGGIPCSSLEA
jgi:hypothetical protein